MLFPSIFEESRICSFNFQLLQTDCFMREMLALCSPNE